MAHMLAIDIDFQRGDFRLDVQARLSASVTGIQGPSGSGKSTLLALIAGLLKPSRGTITLDSQVLVDRGQNLFVPPHRRHIGLVFQDAQLFPHLSVRQNVLYGYQQLKPEQSRFQLADVAALLDISHLLQRRPTQLSGGERQRVALCRAIMCSPTLLLLDEPLAALDGKLKDQILPFLRLIRDEIKIPMCYVSHSLPEIEYLTSHIWQMTAGQLVLEASVSEETPYR